MRVLVLGGDGMLGHELFLSLRDKHETKVTLRQPLAAYAQTRLFDSGNAFGAIDVRNADALKKTFSDFKPEAVVNCAGIVKQRPEADEAIESIEVNSLFPHRAAAACRAMGARFVQLSTDCVFSGDKGNYSERDRPDPVDVYGRSKLLGEVADGAAVTIRTSMIGLGLTRKTSLVDWFLAQQGRANGYRNAIFSGLTTRELSRVIGKIIEKPKAGLYHVSAAPIRKYDLLVALRDRLRRKIEIVPVDEPRIDRSLNSDFFKQSFSYIPPSWDAMLDELAGQIERKAA